MIVEHVGDITSVTAGVIVHQVNCQNAMGSGVAKALYTKYPAVKSEYHTLCNNVGDPRSLYRLAQFVKVSDTITIVNSFSQMYLGNAHLGVVHTCPEYLIDNIIKAYRYANPRGLEVFVPKYVGCGLAGGYWEEISALIKGLPFIVNVVGLPEH